VTTVKPPVTTTKPSATPSRPPVTTGEPPSTSENCDRKSYPDVCIPPYPPDLDCDDVPMKNFKVLPPDPHGFDPDKDGIGCEASTPPGFPMTPPQLPTLR
jgi:micrococcal nuclease